MPTTTERQELAVFRSYSPGDPSPKLYLKNLARQVTEEVGVTARFKWIFNYCIVYVPDIITVTLPLL